jgi:hypothetical protein
MKVRGEIILHQYGNNDKIKRFYALFDSGAAISAISDRTTIEKDDKGFDFDRYGKPRVAELAIENKYGEIIGECRLVIEMDGCLFPRSDIFDVIKDLKEDVIIGRNLMEQYDINLSQDKPALKRKPPVVEII